MRKYYIGVIGGSKPEEKFKHIAFEVGKLLAESNAIIISGGLNGVMEATSRGAFENHGIVIGILPEEVRGSENPYVTYTIPTGMGYARNFLVARSSEALIAIDGASGTLSEASFAISEGRDVIGIESHIIKKMKDEEGEYFIASKPKEAVEMALKSAEKFVRNRVSLS